MPGTHQRHHQPQHQPQPPAPAGHHGVHRPHHKPSHILWKALGVAVPLAVICILLLKHFLDRPPNITITHELTPQEKAQIQADEKSLAEALVRENALKKRAQDFLAAVEGGNESALSNLVSFPRLHDTHQKLEANFKPWNKLSGADQLAAKATLCQLLLGDAEARRFLLESNREPLDVRMGATTAEVVVVRRSRTDPKVEQRRNYQFAYDDGSWFVADVIVPGSGPKAPPTQSELNLAAAILRLQAGLAEIEPQEPLASTSPELRAKIDGFVATIADPKQTSAAMTAQRELVAIGTPAVPAVLNLIVDRKDLKTVDEQIVVNQAVQVVCDIGKIDFNFIPGPEGAAKGAMYAENIKSIRRLFTWWKGAKK